jgi:putative heme-binding domain-containing protein
MRLVCALVVFALLFTTSCERSAVSPGQPARAVIESHLDRSVTVYGSYAVVKLPLKHGVQVWNPAKVLRGPDGVMYGANHTGEIYSLRDTDGDGLEDTALLFCDVREDGLRSPAGLAFKGRDLYVGTAQEVRIYSDRDNDGRADVSRTFFGPVPHSEHPYEWSSALTFGADDHLYLVLTTDSWNPGASPDPEGWRGALLRIAPDGSTAERFVTGLRSVHGMAFNTHGDLFFTDNQGDGNPVEELNLAQRGRFYGYNPAKYGDPTPTEPLHVLRTEIAPTGIAFNAPENDFGGTRGDLFVAFYGPGERWTRGAIGRVRFHRQEDGSYRSEEFPVAANLPTLSDVAFGADGSLYVAQVGKTDYWYQALGEPDGGFYRLFYVPWITPAPIDTTVTRQPSMEAAGQIDQGRQLYADLACSACHAVDGKTELLGPNLKDIGRLSTREELLEDIRDPSLRIKPSMAATRLVLRDGTVLLGRVIGTDAQQVRLMVVGNRIMNVPRADIKLEEPVTQSLMWPGLIGGLSEAQVDALLMYIISLHRANELGG